MADQRDFDSRGRDRLHGQPSQAELDTNFETLPSTRPDDAALDSRAAPTQVLHGDATKPKTRDGRSASDARSPGTDIPAEVGRFRTQRELGRGAFGVVLLAFDPELQVDRAIKMPHRRLIESGKVDPESFIDEARKVAKLSKHAGIVRVLDVQRQNDGVPYVVSEYVAGGSLAERASAQRMSWREAAELVAEVADSIAHAHENGIVHRDLKPGNILIGDDGRPMVTDFGLALDDSEFSYKPSVCGTYMYMSPQQVRGESNRVDGRSDIYSLGVILYQLLARRAPYKSQSVEHLKREILEEQPTPLRQYNSDVPPELEAICQKAMAKEPANRYSTASDFAKALRELARRPAEGVAAARPQTATSNHWLPLVVSAGLFLAVAAGAFALFGRRVEPTPAPAPSSASAAEVPPDLTVHFQKAGEAIFGRTISRADLPLAAGDKAQFHVKLPTPMYAYLYWVASDGHPKRVWPPSDQPLDAQQPVEQLASPPGADRESEPTWWEIQQTGGPQVFFLGVSPTKLDNEQLKDFEAQTAFMRKLLPADELVAEFEYPEQPAMYELRPTGQYRTRGNELVVVVSPKKYAADHSTLQKWFAAYHGWIVATEPAP